MFAFMILISLGLGILILIEKLSGPPPTGLPENAILRSFTKIERRLLKEMPELFDEATKRKLIHQINFFDHSKNLATYEDDQLIVDLQKEKTSFNYKGDQIVVFNSADEDPFDLKENERFNANFGLGDNFSIKSITTSVQSQPNTKSYVKTHLVQVNSTYIISEITFSIEQQEYKAEFFTAFGALNRWTISPNPKEIEASEELKIIAAEQINHPAIYHPDSIRRTKMNMMSPYHAIKESQEVVEFKGLLKKILESHKPINIYEPTSNDNNEYCRKTKLKSVFPRKYLSIIRQVEGVDFENFSIIGITQIKTIIIKNETYYPFINFKNGSIAVKKGERNSSLYFCKKETDNILELGDDFEQILFDKIKSLALS